MNIFVLLLSSAAAAATPAADHAADLCGPKLAATAGGTLGGMDVEASSVSNGWTIIRGNLIALTSMASAGDETARANHVIRTVHSYVCWVRNGRVVKQQLEPYH
jgi:hypothetical protein